MRENRNDPQNQAGGGQQQNQDNESSNENPQEGMQWDNYQTRSLSSEGADTIKESDLLRADEANQQSTGNASGGQGS